MNSYEYICYSKLAYFIGESITTCNNYNYLEKEPTNTALNTIFSALEKYILCYDCSVDGYETESPLKISGVQITLGVCLKGGNKCKYYQYFDESSNKCKSCSDKFPNCASCNANSCLMCMDGFFINEKVFDYSTGKNRTMCVYNQCPLGTCKYSNTSSCVPSTLQNCLSC